MSVMDENKIDGIGISKDDSKKLRLFISDHLGWGEDTKIHLLVLQHKINAYAAFVETKQYKNVYPNNEFDSVEIEIYFMNEIPNICHQFLAVAEKQLKELNISIVAIYDPM